jgi:hypothetical protein
VTLDVVIDAEIVEPLDKKSAEQLDRRIRLLVGTIHDQMVKLHELVAKAKRGNVHAALGFLYEDDCWALTFDYDEEILALVKCIPNHARQFVSADYGWRISDRWAARLVQTLADIGVTVVGTDGLILRD